MRKWTTVLMLTALLLLGMVAIAQEDAAEDDMMMMSSVWASANGALITADGISEIEADLSAVLATSTGFEGIFSIQSVAFNAAGDGYVTVDYTVDAENKPTAGALMVVEGLVESGMSDQAAVGMGTRLIAGESTGLLTPKGLHIIDELGMVLVADTGAKKIFGWMLDAEGDVAPVLTLNVGEGRAVWDIWYDRGNDILYAAGTDGVALAYDLFSETVLMATEGEMAEGEMMAEPMPTRMITPSDADGNKLSINLHGVDIDYDNNLLILTDIGDVAVNTDGQIFTIGIASLADGATEITARIAGDQTKLGNPVDVIFDLTSGGLYVADKANDVVLFYADINALEGDINTAADAELAFVKPESVEIYPPRPLMMMETE